MDKKVIKITSIALTSILILAVAAFAALEVTAQRFKHKSIPSQSIFGQNLSGLSDEQVQEVITSTIDTNLKRKLTLSYGDTDYILNYEVLRITQDPNTIQSQVQYYQGKPSYSQLLKDILSSNQIQADLTMDPSFIVDYIQRKVPSLKKVSNAYFDNTEDGSLEIIPEKAGVALNEELLAANITSNLLQNRDARIKVDTKIIQPDISAADLEELQGQFAELSNKQINFVYDQNSAQLSLNNNANFIRFQRENDQIVLKANTYELLEFTEEFIQPEIDQSPNTVTISYNPSTGRASFSDKPVIGLAVKQTELRDVTEAALNTAFKEGSEMTVTVPVEEASPTIIADPELIERGITELITSTYTTYYGSAANRMHNIEVGAARYNGLIVKQGEEFSFNQNLGPVDASAGYLPELVIKYDGTYPEYGGGLCQVSSTLYRAALDSGLSITERSPHSYAVSYYAQVMGHGLDATIYPGVKDIKFVNDSPGDILIQTYTEGAIVHFNFYGTKTKQVTYDGPYISNHTTPGSPQYFTSNELAPGVTKQVETPKNGFDVVWYRTITDQEGNESKEEIFSRYNAIPAKYQQGAGAAEASIGAPGA